LVAQADRREREDGSDRRGRGAIVALRRDGYGYGFNGLRLVRGRCIGAPNGGALPGKEAASGDCEAEQEHGGAGPAAVVQEANFAHTVISQSGKGGAWSRRSTTFERAGNRHRARYDGPSSWSRLYNSLTTVKQHGTKKRSRQNARRPRR